MTTNSCWVQDTFWWTFTALCNPEGADEDTSSALFDRLSCSFPRLMLSLGHNLKDIFLKHFYDALAQVCIPHETRGTRTVVHDYWQHAYLGGEQVVFNGLWFGFPGSRKMFTDDMKQKIINTFAEWTQGLRPHKAAFEHWNVSDTRAGTTGRKSRNRQGLGPTVFEDRAATGSDPLAVSRKNRLLLRSRRTADAVQQQQSMNLYKPVVRERVTYELSHRYLLGTCCGGACKAGRHVACLCAARLAVAF